MAKRAVSFDQSWEIDDPFYREIYREAEHLLEVRQNKIHTRISYHFALKLLEEEGGDSRLVLPAILLHDIGYSQVPKDELKHAFGPTIKKPELRRLHETEGVRLAGKILQKMDYPVEFVREIQKIIDGHDTRETAWHINDMIVKDADKLFRFSYEGFNLDYNRFGLDPLKWLDTITSLIPQ